MGTLRERMTKEMQLRRFAEGTQEGYLQAVQKLAEHYDRSPDKINAEEVRDYLLYLVNERKLMWSTVGRISAAIKFLYNKVLERPDITCKIPPRKKSRSFPEILSIEEIRRLLAAASNMKHRMLLMASLTVRKLPNLQFATFGRRDRYSDFEFACGASQAELKYERIHSATVVGNSIREISNI